MKRSILYTLTVMHLLAKPCLGQETFSMTFDDFMKEAENDSSFIEQSTERLKLIDVNNDGKISYNEITNVANASIALNQSDYTKELADMNEEWIKAFHDSDKNNDKELTADEIESFVPQMRYYLLKKSFSTMDRNNDGVYDINDMPTQEEAEEKFKQSMQKMQETMDKLAHMDSNELAQNWLQNISSTIADEDYYQMDKDHDNCVTREEYVEYMLKEGEKEENEEMKLTSVDYSRWYIDTKKENKNCLTKEEYIADRSDFSPINITEHNPEKEAEYAKILFEDMDKDSNGKLTAEEYAEHQYQDDVRRYAPNEPILKKETHYNIFLKTMALDKGWMSKEEFVKDYISE